MNEKQEAENTSLNTVDGVSEINRENKENVTETSVDAIRIQPEEEDVQA